MLSQMWPPSASCFDHILHRRVVIKLDLTYFFKTAAQNAGIVQQHPVFNVAILQDVQDIVGHEGNIAPCFFGPPG